jgi:hypothetical protein
MITASPLVAEAFLRRFAQTDNNEVAFRRDQCYCEVPATVRQGAN